MQQIKDFLAKKALGFYFSAAAAVLALVLFIAYLIGYAGSEYMFWGVPVLTALAFLSFGAMTAFDITAPYASVPLLLLSFGGLCCYMGSIHVYVAASFPDGVNMESILGLSPAFFITLILFVLVIVAANIGVYMKQLKPKAAAQPAQVQSAAAEEAKQ